MNIAGQIRKEYLSESAKDSLVGYAINMDKSKQEDSQYLMLVSFAYL